MHNTKIIIELAEDISTNDMIEVCSDINTRHIEKIRKLFIETMPENEEVHLKAEIEEMEYLNGGD